MSVRWFRRRNHERREPQTVEALTGPFEKRCPCCAATGTLDESEITRDINGRSAPLAVCSVCTAIVNMAELNAFASCHSYPEEKNRASSEEFYDLTREGIAQELSSYDRMIDFFETRCGDFTERSLLDFGFGKGTFMLAAARRFKAVIGVDFNVTTFKQLCMTLPTPPSIEVYTGLDAVPRTVDVVFAWHTLEHLTDVSGVLRTLRSLTNHDGWLIAQVPLFRPAYICSTHFVFLNRRSISLALDKSGYGLCEALYDIDNSFMTVLARCV